MDKDCSHPTIFDAPPVDSLFLAVLILDKDKDCSHPNQIRFFDDQLRWEVVENKKRDGDIISSKRPETLYLSQNLPTKWKDDLWQPNTCKKCLQKLTIGSATQICNSSEVFLIHYHFMNEIFAM